MNVSLLMSNIKKLCDNHNITINKMLHECQLHKNVIDNMRGEKPSIPSIDKIFTIAKYFNVSVDYLLGYTPTIDNEEQELINFFINLSPENKRLAINLVKTVIETEKE